MAKAIEANWKEIQLAVCSGMEFSDASKAFGVSYHTIKKRAIREQWPTKFAVAKRAKMLQEQKVSAIQSDNGIVSLNVSQPDLTTKIAQNWIENQESHRALAFEMAHGALKGLKNDVPKPKDWQDIERADRMARRAAGLDDKEGGIAVNQALILVNQRIDSCSLPIE